MNNYILPGIYIEKGIEEQRVNLNTFSTLFLSFELNSDDIEKTTKVIYLRSISDLEKSTFVRKEMLLFKIIHAYFDNGGKSLYIMPQANDKDTLLDSKKYFKFLEQNIDSLIDVETIIAVDLLVQEKFDFKDTQRQVIQNSIASYCKKSNRLSLTDLPIESHPLVYVETLMSTIVCYPWIINNRGATLPSSLYVAAILSHLASEDKISHSIANIKFKNAIDTNMLIDNDYAARLYTESINPIVHVQNDGYKIWGIRTLNDEIKDINTLRVLFLIKRALYLIGKEYIFEVHDQRLEEKMIRKITSFLFLLWKKGALKGISQDEAFLLSIESNDELIIHVAVSIAKPLEFIVIHLNRQTNSDSQSTLNIT